MRITFAIVVILLTLACQHVVEENHLEKPVSRRTALLNYVLEELASQDIHVVGFEQKPMYDTSCIVLNDTFKALFDDLSTLAFFEENLPREIRWDTTIFYTTQLQSFYFDVIYLYDRKVKFVQADSLLPTCGKNDFAGIGSPLFSKDSTQAVLKIIKQCANYITRSEAIYEYEMNSQKWYKVHEFKLCIPAAILDRPVLWD